MQEEKQRSSFQQVNLEVPLKEHIEQWQILHHKIHENERIERDTALRAQDMRLEAMNEFRAQINMERGNYVTRTEMDAALDALSSRITKTEKSLDRTGGYAAAMLFMFTVVATVVGLGIRFL